MFCRTSTSLTEKLVKDLLDGAKFLAQCCCDRKSRAAYAQSFALWQQATIEFTCRDHSPPTLVIMFNRSHVNIGRACTPRSLYYCLFAPHTCIFVLRAHPVRGESHNQRNTTGEVATMSVFQSENRTAHYCPTTRLPSFGKTHDHPKGLVNRCMVCLK